VEYDPEYEKIQRGMADIEAGRSISQEEVEKQMEKWLAE